MPRAGPVTGGASWNPHLCRALGPCRHRSGRTYRASVDSDSDGEIRLSDGRNVTLRVAGPADVPRIAELYTGLSAESFRRRFHSGRPKPVLLARLARIDVAPGTVSLIAATPGSEQPGRGGQVRAHGRGCGRARARRPG